jgi:hypothetical protein
MFWLFPIYTLLFVAIVARRFRYKSLRRLGYSSRFAHDFYFLKPETFKSPIRHRLRSLRSTKPGLSNSPHPSWRRRVTAEPRRRRRRDWNSLPLASVSLILAEEKGRSIRVVLTDAVPFHGGPAVRISFAPAGSPVRTCDGRQLVRHPVDGVVRLERRHQGVVVGDEIGLREAEAEFRGDLAQLLQCRDLDRVERHRRPRPASRLPAADSGVRRGTAPPAARPAGDRSTA